MANHGIMSDEETLKIKDTFCDIRHFILKIRIGKKVIQHKVTIITPSKSHNPLESELEMNTML